MALSKIVADSFAIRHLVLLGFDVPANIVLRSTAEYMELLVALLHKPALANEFVETDVPEQATEFWRTHVGGGRLRLRVDAAWQDSLGEHAGEAAQWFARSGYRSHNKLSSLSHPSFVGGMLSAIPMKTKHTEEKWLAMWGDRSEGSVTTLFIYMNYFFPLLVLFREFPFAGHERHMASSIEFDTASELHRHVKFGRDILGSLALSLCMDSNAHLFPDYDMSIFEKAEE